MRVRIFIDFWNLQIAWNQYHEGKGKGAPKTPVRIPWQNTLPEVLVRRAAKEGRYSGCHVYASYDPLKTSDRGLRKFLHAMDGFPGYSVTVKARKPRSPHRCPNEACRSEIRFCPSCKQEIKRTVEKGVDTALVTDLIQHAIDGLFDCAVLVTADADFVPAVEFVQNRTPCRIIHAHIRPQGQELRNACWDHFYLDDVMSELLAPPPSP